MRRCPRRLLSSGTAALIVVGMLALAGERGRQALLTVPPGHLALLLGLTFLMTVVTAWRWATLVSAVAGGPGIGVLRVYRSFIVSRALGLFVPQVASDIAVRPLLLRASTETTTGAGVVGSLLEKVLDLSLLAIALVPSMAFLVDFEPLPFAAGWLAASVLWLLGALAFGDVGLRAIAGPLAFLAQRVGLRGPAWFRRAAGWAGRAADDLREAAVDTRAFRLAALLTIVRYGLVATVFFAVAGSLGLPAIGVVEILVVLPLAQAALVLAFTPGGIGFLEGGFWGGFALLGLPGDQIAAYVLGQRVLVGMAILVFAGLSLLLPRGWETPAGRCGEPPVNPGGRVANDS